MKNTLIVYLGNQVESSAYVDKKIIYITMLKKVNSRRLHPKEKKEMAKFFHIEIQIKKKNVDALFDLCS